MLRSIFYVLAFFFVALQLTSAGSVDWDDVTMIPPMDYALFRQVRGLTESKPVQNDIPTENGVLKIPSYYLPNRAFGGRYRNSRSIIGDQPEGALDYPIDFFFPRGPRSYPGSYAEWKTSMPKWAPRTPPQPQPQPQSE